MLLGARHGLEIRAAAAADAVGLAALLGAAGRAADPHLLAERLEAIRQHGGRALIAVAWGPPSGIVVLHWHRTLEAALPAAQITTILVGPDERRRGVGRLLLKAAAQAARTAGCGTLELLAPPDRPDLVAFARETGFEPVAGCFARPLRKKV